MPFLFCFNNKSQVAVAPAEEMASGPEPESVSSNRSFELLKIHRAAYHSAMPYQAFVKEKQAQAKQQPKLYDTSASTPRDAWSDPVIEIRPVEARLANKMI